MSDARTSEEDRKLISSAGPAANRGGGRWGSIGVPTERSGDFRGALRRLGELLGRERLRLWYVLFLTIWSVVLIVLGPRLLGQATDIIVRGVISGQGIDYGELHGKLLFILALYMGSWVLSFSQAYILAGVVQRSMYALRDQVEHKLNRLPLSYVDKQARGDLLSRVTNDIDNLAQSLQQTVSQILTSTLMLLGVAVMMFTISPLMAMIALVTVPVSVWLMKMIGGRARPRFMAQWRHTGEVNSQVEEVFTGHMVVRSFGSRKRTTHCSSRASAPSSCRV
jgi:ATP-binding cassette subfamily B multidrug efflux pump